MQNLEQIRAQSVLKLKRSLQANNQEVAGVNNGKVVKKIPPMIMNHGLLSTLAYAFEEKNNAYRILFDAVAKHLQHESIKVLPERNARNQAIQATTNGLFDFLTESDSQTLRRATDETMKWFDYARRLI